MSAASWLLQNALIATVAAFVLAVGLTRWRVPARVEHLLWLVLAVKFLAPPLVRIPLAEELFAGTVLEVAVPAADPRPPAPALAASTAAAPAIATAPATATAQRSFGSGAPSPSTIGRLLLALWCAGALFMFGHQAARLASWHRRRRPEAAPPELVRVVDEVAAALGIRSPRVVLDEALETPVVAGLLRPRLFWPVALMESMPATVSRTVIAHELSHIRRRDLWVGVVELVGRCVWWWYPGWGFVQRRLRDAAERACDDAVIRLYPSLRRRYAEGLLEVASAAASPRPAAALGLDGPGSMRRRLRAVLAPSPPMRHRSGALALVVFALVLLPAWTAQRGNAPDALLSALRHAAVDREPDVRRAVANALREVAADEAAETLRMLAGDADEDVRRAARVALGLEAARPNRIFPAPGASPSPDPVPFASLARSLAEGDLTERLNATSRLGEQRDRRAVPLLLGALRDPDFRVRQYAADALAGIGSAEATTDLLALLDDPHARVRQSAASALGRHDEPRVIAALAAALEDEDTHVRQVAVGALGRIAAGRAR